MNLSSIFSAQKAAAAAVAALFSAGALNLVHQAAASGHGEGDHGVAAAKPQAGEAAA